MFLLFNIITNYFFFAVFSPESEEVLHRFTTRQYYSYTAALGVTIGVGCLLLFLNVLIFAGIYYQREKDRQRNANEEHPNQNVSTDTLSYSQQHAIRESSLNKSIDFTKKEKVKQFTTASYSTIPSSMEMDCRFSSDRNSLKNNQQAVLLRTSTNNSRGGSIKKRVQIQEISV